MSIAANSARTRATITGVKRLSDKAQKVKLEASEDYVWSAGQHFSVSRDTEGKNVAYYSIASAPQPESPGALELVVSGASFCAGEEAKVGVQYWLAPAQGKFEISHVLLAKRLILVGMGTGIAPLRAMIQALAARNDGPDEMTLVQGCRVLEECLFYEEFSSYGPQLDYRPVISQPPENWEGRRGRVQHHLLDTPVKDVAYCVCGSPKMVGEVRELLQSRGLDLGHFFSEGN